MANNQINKLAEFANLQMAAEAFLVQGNEITPASADVSDRLRRGNTHASRFTSVQATQFTSQYEVITQYRNDPLRADGAGFSGTLFRNRQTGELTLSFRSTEFLDDAVRDSKSTNEFEISDIGWALGQISEMEAWYSELRLDPNLLGGKLFNVTGYSLGGHLAAAFNILRREQFSATGDPDSNPILNTYTFNGAGTGSIKNNGRLTDLLADFHRIKANYQESDEWKAVSALDRPVILAAATNRVEQINSEVSRVAGLTGLKNTNFENSSAPKGVQASVEYQIAALLVRRKTSGALANIRVGGALGVSAELVQVPVSQRISNMLEIVGMEQGGLATSFVSNSGFHYGSRVSIPIEGQPYFRGNYLGNLVTESIRSGGLIKLLVDSPEMNDFGDTHSLVLLIDSLSLMATMEGLDPSLTPEVAQEIFYAASDAAVVTTLGGAAPANQGKAEGDTLERVLDALYRLFVDPQENSLTASRNGNTWHDSIQRSAFHTRLAALEEAIYGDEGEGLEGRFVLKPLSTRVDASNTIFMDAQSIKTLADADTSKGAAWRFALVHLNPFVAELANDNVVLPRYEEAAYALYDAETGEGALTESWLQARAEMLHWKNRDFEQNRSKTLRGNLAESLSFVDKTIKEYDGADLRIAVQGRNPRSVSVISFGLEAVDQLIGSNSVAGDRLYGNGGDDIINGNGGNDYLEGGTGADTLNGGDGNDTILGMQGNDIIDGGLGSDELDGGLGQDTYYYRLGKGQGVDSIFDPDGLGSIRIYTSGETHVVLNGGKKIGDGLWESDDGLITYTLGDDGAGSFTMHAVHAKGGGLIVHGFNNGELGITLDAAPEPEPPLPPTNRTISGQWAPQIQTDEFGRTYYVYDDLGNHLRQADVPDDNNQPTPTFGVRGNRLIGSAGDDYVFVTGKESVGWGNGGSDVIVGDDNSAEIIYGGPGNDRIEAKGNTRLLTDYGEFVFFGRTVKQGEDMLLGGAGNDRIYGESSDTVDTLTNPSTLATGLPGDWSRGGSGDDEIYGGAGNDVLQGGVGSDRILGGAGRDVLIADDDLDLTFGQLRWAVVHPYFGETMPGGNIFDVGLYSVSNVIIAEPNAIYSGVNEFGATEVATGDAAFTYYKNGGAADVLFGGAGNDILIGQLGDDQLYGEGDDDVLAGWEGDDLLLGGEGNDHLAGDFGRHEQPNQRIFQAVASQALIVPAPVGSGNSLNSNGSTVNQSGKDYLDGGAGNDVLYGDGGDDVLIGGTGADVLHGDGGYLPEELHGADILDGGAGSDLLYGNAGNDDLSGGEGNDLLDGGAGNDQLDGGIDNDNLVGGSGNDILVGGKGNDNLAGGDDDDTLYGGEGDDTLNGGAGNDTLIDEQGSNTLIGGGGKDSLIGSNLADTLSGGDGDDFIDSGAGNDIVSGGAGNDTYSLNLGDGSDQIADAEGTNRIEFGDDVLASSLNGSWNGSTLNVSFGAGGDSFSMDAAEFKVDRLDFKDGTQWTQKTLINSAPYITFSGTGAANNLQGLAYAKTELLGLAGHDVLTGAIYDDRLAGGDGEDFLDGRQGSDQYFFTFGEVGIDAVADSETSGNAYFNWFYANLGITDWQIRYEHGGQYQVIAEGDGGFTTRYFVTRQEAIDTFPEAVATLIEPLPVLAPIVLRNDSTVLSTLTAAGILPADTVVFGPGITLGDLRLIATANPNLAGHQNVQLSGGGDLSVRWGGAGFDIAVPDLNYGYNGDLATYALGQGIERFEFADGSVCTLEQLLDQAALRIDYTDGAVFERGTHENEFLTGGAVADTLYGKAGDDWLTGATDNDLLDGGDGNDFLFGDDFSGRPGGNDVLLGGAGDDQLNGQDGDDLLDGGAGDDALVGGAGADRYIFGVGSGHDQVDADEADIVIAHEVVSGDLVVSRVFGWDLMLQIRDGGDRMIATSWFEDDTYRYGGIELAGGVFLDAGELEARLEVTPATAGDDLIGGTSGDDVIAGLAGNDEIYGNDGIDLVHGGEGDDSLNEYAGAGVLDGGSGDDSIYDEAGAQFIIGGAGDDFINAYGAAAPSVIAFNPGDGADTIYAVESFVLSIGGGISPDDLSLSFNPDGEGLILAIGASDSIRLTREYEAEAQAWPAITLQLFGSAHLYDFNGAIAALYAGSVDSIALGDALPALEFETSEFSGLGGLLANEYQLHGNLDALTEEEIRDVLASPGFGIALQPLSLGLTLTGTTGNDELVGGLGNDLLDGLEGADTLRGGAGNDRYVVDQSGDVVIELLNEGRDTVSSSVTLTLAANVEALILTGDANINGTGNTLANEITGNAGNNRLDGRAGADVMRGGLGNDTYVIDNIYDFIDEQSEAGADAVISSIDYTLGAHLENLTLSGAAINGGGNSADNRLTGNARDNVLHGGAGDDVINGGAGADMLIGGAGDDSFIIDNVADQVVELADEGVDTVQSSVSHSLHDHVENLTLTGSSATGGVGNALDNLLTGNAADNQLTGLDGNDTLDGKAGADSMVGGLGDDRYVVDQAGDNLTELADQGLDTVSSTVSWTLGGHFENLILTGAALLNATGNSLNNQLTGNNSANVLTGLDGDDWLDGKGGADLMFGGAGNDSYVVAQSGDVVAELEGAGSDTVRASITWTLGDHLEHLVLTGSSNIRGYGNTQANSLSGNTGNNLLDGGLGADLMAGGSGNDTYYIDDAGDQIVELADQGVDTIRSSVSRVLETNVENLVLTGTAAISGEGNALANVLSGNAAANTLLGGDGNDIINGGAGVDIMIGGNGNDLYTVDNTGDLVIEQAGGGIDTVQTSLNHTLAAQVENLVLTGAGNRSGTGNALDNILSGNRGANTLNGGAGNDTLAGGLGNDTYRFDPGFGRDVIAEDDPTVGNLDRIVFGAGISAANIKLGRLNDDLLVETTDHQNSIQIADWFAAARHQIERIEFAGGPFWDLAAIQSQAMQSVNMPGFLRGDSDASELLGQIGNTLIEGQGGADILTDGEGNNLFSGGVGDDVATGGDGNDLFVGGSGNDSIHTGGGSNIVAFNAGDGVDTVYSSGDADNTLSLGGGLRYSDLSLSRSSNDLVLNAGASDKLVFKDWYAGGNKFANLQFILDASPDFDSAASDPIYNRRVQSFDFAGMVSAFDAAQNNNPGISAWALGDALTQFHLSGSDDSALGGDLAYWYARNGALSGIGVTAAQQVIGAPGFGAEAQTLREFAGLQDGLVRLS